MTDRLHLRRATPDDRAAIQALLEADPDYARRVTGRPPTPDDAAELLTEGPPMLDPERKVVLGAFDDDALVAVIDVLRGWPAPDTAHIGLLQVHAQRKGEGVGRRAHDLLLDVVEAWPEIDLVRAAIVETNAEQAAPFWAALGYTPEGTPRPFEQGSVRTTVRVWTRPVRRRS